MRQVILLHITLIYSQTVSPQTQEKQSNSPKETCVESINLGWTQLQDLPAFCACRASWLQPKLPPDQAKIGRYKNKSTERHGEIILVWGHPVTCHCGHSFRQTVSQDISWLFLKGVIKVPKEVRTSCLCTGAELGYQVWSFSKRICCRHLWLLLLLSSYQTLL